MVMRVVSNPLFPEDPNGNNREPIVWVLSEMHPFIPAMKIVRMFYDVDAGGVEIYSTDGKKGVRHIVPMNVIRLVEEVMSMDVLCNELEIAESDEPDPDEPDPEETQPAVQAHDDRTST